MQKKAILSVILAGILWGVISIFINVLSAAGFDSLQISLIRLTGIASGVFYGMYTIFGKYALARYDSMTVTAYSFLFGVIGSIPLGRKGKTVAIIVLNLPDHGPGAGLPGQK